MDAKDYLRQVVYSLIQGDEASAKAYQHTYFELKARELLREDHDVLLTSKGLEDFLKTLHKRAKKEKKDEDFLKTLAKHTGKSEVTEKDFVECADHLAKNKKKADLFIHDVEHKLKLTKDDPAKDIKDTEAGD